MKNIKKEPITSLLSQYVEIMDELRDRNILRSANILTGDLAEYLFCRAFGWRQEPNSTKAFDATDKDGRRYQIKGRRLHKHGTSRQMSAIRSPEGFDFLAAVLFDHEYSVRRAALIPKQTVSSFSKFNEHTNSYLFHLREEVWDALDVQDVTLKLLSVEIHS